MLLKILKFEINYRKARPATYIYFGILLLISFLGVATDAVSFGGGTGLVKQNAPSVLLNIMLLLTALMTVISSAVMGVPVLRDFEHQTESLMFSTPIKKRDYLLGRFFGSYLVLVFIFLGIPLGLMLGDLMPWREADKLGPFNPAAYFQPFLIFVMPNLFVSGAIFFAGGTLSRKMLLVYVQGMLLLVLFLASQSLLRDIENKDIASLLDPFGVRTVSVLTRYWSVAEQNTLMVGLNGLVLQNRLLWLAVGVLTLVGTHFGFSFSVNRGRGGKKKYRPEALETANTGMAIPKVQLQHGGGVVLKQLLSQTVFYFRSLLKEAPFWGIVLCGILLLSINAQYMGQAFGAYTYPTTYLVLEQLQGFTLFFIIIIVFYSGELIWKERGVKMDQIYDALPVSDAVGLVSKLLGLLLSLAVLCVLLIFTGICIQVIKGYFEFEIGLYFSRLFYGTYPQLLLFSLLAFFVHVMVNQKFIGHAVIILFFISTSVLYEWGIEHSLFQFGSGSLGAFSDMNGFGHYPTGYNWMTGYWLAFSLLLFTLAVVFSVRGTESLMKIRMRVGKLRLGKGLVATGVLAILGFGLSGSVIYYNTNVLNEYSNSDETKKLRADYEKTLKKFADVPQLKIADVYMAVDIYPYERDYDARGHYLLVNRTGQPVQEVHVQRSADHQVTQKIAFEGGAEVKQEWPEFNYVIYQLPRPLQPGETVKMNIEQQFRTHGFVESGSSTSVVFNGTFFNSSVFPTLGYSAGFELGSIDDREDYELPEKDRLPPRDDKTGLGNHFLGDDADQVNFEIVLSTDSSQIAIAPGYLQEERLEGDRRYFHYKMDVPIINFYNVVSARYEVMRDRWVPENDSLGTPVNLEIYYHKGHEYNLSRMMKAMKMSLDYYSENFSPYQYRQMRIMEFPRYANFAQSFANTVPFSEGIGFMLDLEDEAVDVSFFVTAHEMAHQWWGHQVAAADVQGSQVLSESLSQYAALMVMKQAYPEEKVREFLKEEQQRYLRGRGGETRREMPLETVEAQNYIHYGKGALVFYALQDYIGEDSLNVALNRLIKKWNIIDGPGEPDRRYPTTHDLMDELRKVTPDTLQYLLTDMFERITLFENKAEAARYRELPGGGYEVSLDYEAKKVESDSLGMETDLPLNDLIEIGVFGEDEEGEDTLLYLQKYRLTDAEGTITVKVDEEPKKMGIDPLYKLIDRNTDDNVKSVTMEEGS